jgi:PAS domain-containing protein
MNDLVFLHRSNIANEECYIDWCLVPFPREPDDPLTTAIPGTETGMGTGTEAGMLGGTSDLRIAEKGRVGGLVNPVFESTSRVLMDRRLRLLREMGARVSVARNTQEFWGIVIRELREAELDIPGVVAYSVCDQTDMLHFVGQIGLEQGDAFFPGTLDLNHLSEFGVEGYIRRILDGDSVIIEGEDVLMSFERRGWGDIFTTAVLVPIKPSTTRPPQGVLFFVLSPRRPYDEDYALFIEILTRQIATSLTNVQLFEEEIRRGREIADADRRKGEELERALAQRTREVRASEGFMGRLAEICPVGIFVSDGQGNITFVNDTWVPILLTILSNGSTR